MKKFTLKTERLLLRPLKLSDVDTILPNANDKAQTRFLKRVEPPMSRRVEEQWVCDSWKKWKNGSSLVFAAVRTDSKEMVGCLELLDVSKTHRNAKIGIFFFKKHWGKGFGTEAVERLIRFGFEELKLNRIEYGFLAHNKRSEGIFKRLGFKREGLQREFLFKRGKFQDHVLGSLLSSEWERREKEKDKKKTR